jgi:hypothetical protein
MKARVSVDIYTKIVLTVIALCLVWLCLTNARSVAPLQAQGPELVDVRIRAIDRQPGSRWDPLTVQADEPLPAEVLNEESIPVVVTNEMVPVDIKQATIKQSPTPLDKQ